MDSCSLRDGVLLKFNMKKMLDLGLQCKSMDSLSLRPLDNTFNTDSFFLIPTHTEP
jgi:hypothetical protein